MIDSVLETNPWTYNIKDISGEIIIGSIYEKQLLLSKLKVIYYPEPDSCIRDKVKVIDFFDKLKTVPIDLKKLSDLVDEKVVKNTKCDLLNTKVNNFEKITTNLILINQNNAGKQNLGKKQELIKKYLTLEV